MKSSSGFTLVELLVVIAVLGVMSAVVLIAIDPLEQISRGRDSNRKSSIGQLGRALQAYYTSQSSYPTPNSSWMSALVTAGEIKTLAAQIPGSTACWPDASGNEVNGFCYTGTGTDAYVWTRIQSKSEKNKCPSAANVFFSYHSSDGRACLGCESYSLCNSTEN